MLLIVLHSFEIDRVSLVVILSIEGTLNAELELLHHLLATTFLDTVVLRLSNHGLNVLGEGDVEEDGAAQPPFWKCQSLFAFTAS